MGGILFFVVMVVVVDLVVSVLWLKGEFTFVYSY